MLQRYYKIKDHINPNKELFIVIEELKECTGMGGKIVQNLRTKEKTFFNDDKFGNSFLKY